MGKLVLHLPDGTTRDILLEKERVTIGRRADNDIALPYPAVSGEHAAVVTILADSFLEDVGSTNGTFVNDKSVTKHFLRDGDRLDIGREILVYYSDDAAVPAPLPPELLQHDRGDVIEPLSEQLSALSDLTKNRSSRVGESRPVVAEFDPQSNVPMTGQIATEFDALSEEGDATERTRPVRRVPHTERETLEDGTAPEVEPQRDLPPPIFVARVVTGPNSGREVTIADREVTIGRVGLQVVKLWREADHARIVPVEGTVLPMRNGETIDAEGAALFPGDMFEVAGATVSLVRV